MKEQRRVLTARLPVNGNLTKSDVFTSEQFEALKELRPEMSESILVQEALLHYSRILPDLLIAEQEAEIERLKSVKLKLFT